MLLINFLIIKNKHYHLPAHNNTKDINRSDLVFFLTVTSGNTFDEIYLRIFWDPLKLQIRPLRSFQPSN